jgi:hypothetical protein
MRPPRKLFCNGRDNQPFRSRHSLQDLRRPDFCRSRKHAQTPWTWALWLYGPGLEILSQRALDVGGNKTPLARVSLYSQSSKRMIGWKG